MSAEVEEIMPPSELAPEKPDSEVPEGDDAVEADSPEEPSAPPKGSSSSSPSDQEPKGPRPSNPPDQEPKGPRPSNPPDQGPKGPRSSFSNPPDQGPKGPRASVSKAADPSDPLPPKSPGSKVNFHRPPARPVGGGHKSTMQRKLGQAINRASRYLPNCRGCERWVYAAVYVALYTLLMLFRMSTFSFILVMIYTVLFTLLVLRYYGHGPLANAFGPTRSPLRR